MFIGDNYCIPHDKQTYSFASVRYILVLYPIISLLYQCYIIIMHIFPYFSGHTSPLYHVDAICVGSVILLALQSKTIQFDPNNIRIVLCQSKKYGNGQSTIYIYIYRIFSQLNAHL